MKYTDICEYFDNDDLATLLKDIKPIFDQIDDYAEDFLKNRMDDSDEMRKAKQYLCGAISTLEPIYSKALSYKKQMEYRFYVDKKYECESKDIKFTDSSTEKEAKNSVRNFRDLRDILRGYLNSATSLYFDLKGRLEKNAGEYSRIE